MMRYQSIGLGLAVAVMVLPVAEIQGPVTQAPVMPRYCAGR